MKQNLLYTDRVWKESLLSKEGKWKEEQGEDGITRWTTESPLLLAAWSKGASASKTWPLTTRLQVKAMSGKPCSAMQGWLPAQ